HVAGIIAAEYHGKMRGVCPDVRIIPIRVLGYAKSSAIEAKGGPKDEGYLEALLEAIDHAVDNGAHILNFSVGWELPQATNVATAKKYEAFREGLKKKLED